MSPVLAWDGHVQTIEHKRVPSRIHRERIAHLARDGRIGSIGLGGSVESRMWDPNRLYCERRDKATQSAELVVIKRTSPASFMEKQGSCPSL